MKVWGHTWVSTYFETNGGKCLHMLFFRLSCSDPTKLIWMFDKNTFICLAFHFNAETFAFNYWGIQGCTPEECPGEKSFLFSMFIFPCTSSIFGHTEMKFFFCRQAMKERMSNLAQSLGMPQGLTPQWGI